MTGRPAIRRTPILPTQLQGRPRSRVAAASSRSAGWQSAAGPSGQRFPAPSGRSLAAIARSRALSSSPDGMPMDGDRTGPWACWTKHRYPGSGAAQVITGATELPTITAALCAGPHEGPELSRPVSKSIRAVLGPPSNLQPVSPTLL
jgi:hypothetical protein